MYRAIGVEPTNDTAATSGCSRIRSTATLSPWTTLKTPSGTPAPWGRPAGKIAAGDAGLVEERGEEDRRRGILLGRLQDERVAAGDRRCEHPHRDHRREVERRDPGHDAERLPDLVDVDPAGELLRRGHPREAGR